MGDQCFMLFLADGYMTLLLHADTHRLKPVGSELITFLGQSLSQLYCYTVYCRHLFSTQ